MQEVQVEGNTARYKGVKMGRRTKKAKVLIATPNYTNLFASEVYVSHMECATAWTRWGIDFSWSVVGRTFVHFARTLLTQAAIDAKFTHVFWLDDDAIINAELLPRYLEHNKEVIITPYPMRRPKHEIGVLVSTVGDFHNHGSYRNLTLADLNQGLIEVDGGGTHAMLVNMDVFLKRGKATRYHSPYPPALMEVFDRLSEEDKKTIDFYVGELPDESMTLAEEHLVGGKPYFMMPKAGTEDMLWCYRAKKKGVKIWCDTDVFSGHVGFAPIITKWHTTMAENHQAQAIETMSGDVPSVLTDRKPEQQDLEAEVSTVRRHVLDSRKAANLI